MRAYSLQFGAHDVRGLSRLQLRSANFGVGAVKLNQRMSVDLEWGKLDASLATRLVEILNRQLSNAKRPSFIGPVSVLSFEFGTIPPDVELVDLCDIYRDFLEDDEDEDDNGNPLKADGTDLDEDYEWVSRRTGNREESRGFQYLPPHLRYGRGMPDMFLTMPSLHPSSMGMSWSSSTGSLGVPQPHNPYLHIPSPATPFSPAAIKQHESRSSVDSSNTTISGAAIPPSWRSPLSSLPRAYGTGSDTSDPTQARYPFEPPTPPPAPPPPAENPYPNLQMHFHINWNADLRITLTTSLLINYPSPMFMSLPIKLSVTGLLFNGEVVVAYEGERKRVHLTILDDLDPYGPVSDRPKRDSTSPDGDEDHPTPQAQHSGYGRQAKPLPIGQRLLPSVYIESEIGQNDKHVLKNVGRIEKFVQDVIRKTVEEELVFPNFHTLVLG